MKIINLSKINFLYYYINKLLEKYIHYISRCETENDFYKILNDYRYNVKLDIKEFHDSNYDFQLEFKIFVQIGYLYTSATNNDRYYIINIKKVNTHDILGTIIDDLFDRNELCKKYDNLQIIIDDPNGNYKLNKEKNEDKIVDWYLYTDGIKKDNYLKLVDESSDKLTITNIMNASYVMKQGIINNHVFSSILYTKVMDIYLLDEIAKQYCKKR